MLIFIYVILSHSYEIYLFFFRSFYSLIYCSMYTLHMRSGLFDINYVDHLQNQAALQPERTAGTQKKRGWGVDAGVRVPYLPLWMQPLGRLLKLNVAIFPKNHQTVMFTVTTPFFGETSASHPPFFCPCYCWLIEIPQKLFPSNFSRRSHTNFTFFFQPTDGYHVNL